MVTARAACAAPATPAPAPAPAPPQVIPIRNGDFESGSDGWTIADKGISSISREQAASGRCSLKVVDNDEKLGSDVTSARVALEAGRLYRLQAKVYPVSGTGLGIYVRFYDRFHRMIGKGDSCMRGAPDKPLNQWVPFSLDVTPPEGTVAADVNVHSYGAAKVTAYLDDFRFEVVSLESGKSPWPGTYKIHPNERTKLTAADVVGPDGLVYPDWHYAGVRGGIPTAKVAARAEDFGANPNDDRDDADAMERAADAVGAHGGGALLLSAGTYILDRPIFIARDNVVLRGAGQDKTRIIFRYGVGAGIPKGGVAFLGLRDGATINALTMVEAHADPVDLQAITITLDGQQVAHTERHPHWGATFSLRASTYALLGKAAGRDAHALKAVAEYPNGRKAETTIAVHLDRSPQQGEPHAPSFIAAINFVGPTTAGKKLALAADGNRGDMVLRLTSTEGLAAGDAIVLQAPNTPRWVALVQDANNAAAVRRYEFEVAGVSGNDVRLNQPLRLDYPLIDGPYVQKISVMRHCGVEDLSLEQTRDLWTTGIVFSHVRDCWAQRVTVKKAGRFPLYFTPAKWCQVRECTFDDAWFKGGGGTAYVGWEGAYDCLMENVTTFNLRHAPLVQWSAAGNVVRNSAFHNSDAQWHSGWTNENLFENCVVDSAEGKANGGYGYGMWASPPEDDAHGPNGPRNVVWNCDVASGKTGVWLGGMNEGWIFAYNRFTVANGPGVLVKTASFDHQFRDNLFILKDGRSPLIELMTPDCVGIELTGNRALGAARLYLGSAKPLLDRDNTIHPLADAPRPKTPVPSIFEWERSHR